MDGLRAYILTVPHSGTTSARKLLDTWETPYSFNHFEKIPEVVLPRILEEFNVLTTLRDPYMVAASWANTFGWGMPAVMRRWKANWTRWGIVAPRATKLLTMQDLPDNLNQHRDVSGAKKAYLGRDMERYFSAVPREAVDFAYEIVSKIDWVKH